MRAEREQLGLRLAAEVGPDLRVIKYFNMMDEGKVTGYFCQGLTRLRPSRTKTKW